MKENLNGISICPAVSYCLDLKHMLGATSGQFTSDLLGAVVHYGLPAEFDTQDGVVMLYHGTDGVTLRCLRGDHFTDQHVTLENGKLAVKVKDIAQSAKNNDTVPPEDFEAPETYQSDVSHEVPPIETSRLDECIKNSTLISNHFLYDATTLLNLLIEHGIPNEFYAQGGEIQLIFDPADHKPMLTSTANPYQWIEHDADHLITMCRCSVCGKEGTFESLEWNIPGDVCYWCQ
jgi:hypothetical protein